jgi:hypothetical protein
MPQPLSRVSPDGKLHFSAGVLRKSRFAADVAYVIATWAHIDGDIASILSRMLNTDIAVGTAMYMALIGSGGQKAALAAAAREALPEWQCLLLQAINKVTASARDQRNEFAHHVWGVCSTLPDALLLTEAKIVVAYNVAMRQVVERLDEGRGIIAPKPIDCSKVMVYRENDIAAAVEGAQRATHLYQLFYAMLVSISGPGPAAQLLGDIHVHAQLCKLAANSGQEVRAQLGLTSK